MTLLSAVVADSINDVSSTRKVYLLAGALVLLGVLLIIVTVWFWRTTRHDPELLGPLEQMGTKKFRTVDAATQQTMLDTARPPDAQPMKWGLVRGDASANADVAVDGASGPATPEEAVAVAVVASSASVVPAVVDDDVGHADSEAPVPAAVVAAADPVPEVDADDVDAHDLDVHDEAIPEPVEAVAAHDARPNGTTNEGSPFVIVPLDHDLVPDRDPAPAPAAERMVELHDDEADAPDDTARPAIDPLLRMFEGS